MTARSRLRLRGRAGPRLVGVRARPSPVGAVGARDRHRRRCAGRRRWGSPRRRPRELLDQLGAQANLLTVAPGQTFGGDAGPLPATAPAMIGAVPPVRTVATVAQVQGATVRRTPRCPAIDTGGITVLAASADAARDRLGPGRRRARPGRRRRSLSRGAARAQAATTLGVVRLDATTQVYLDGTYMTVVGVLAPVDVAPELDERGARHPWRRGPGAARRRRADPHLPAGGPRPGRRGRRRAAVDRVTRPRRRRVEVRRPSDVPRGAAGGQVGVHRTVPGSRCRGAARRRCRDREHHGDLRARASWRDRRPAGPRCPPRARGRAVPRRGPRCSRRPAACWASRSGHWPPP